MDFTDLLAQWKELGTLGVGVLILAKLGARVLDWVLDNSGVKIKRRLSREDGWEAKFENQDRRLDLCESRLSKLEQVYRVTHQLAHSAASGIERECGRVPINAANILFYVAQLRTIQTLDEVWGEAPPRATSPSPTPPIPGAIPTEVISNVIPKRVLLVDDERDSADVVALVLRQDGYEVSIAHSAQDGLMQHSLKRDAGQPFHLLLLDYAMADETGESVARQVRRQEAERGEAKVKIAFLTGNPDKLARHVLEELGAVCWIKPLDADQIKSRVRQVLA